MNRLITVVVAVAVVVTLDLVFQLNILEAVVIGIIVGLIAPSAIRRCL